MTKILVPLPQGRSKNVPQKFNDGHWAFLGPGEEGKWYQGYAAEDGGKWDLRASQIGGILSDFRTSRIPGVIPLGRGILKKRNNRETITLMWTMAIVTCCTGLFMPPTSSVSTEQSQSGVDRIPEKQAESRPESVRKMSPEIQIKQEDLKSLVDIPRLPHASGHRMLQNLNDFNSMPLMSKIEHLRTTAEFYHPIEKGNFYVTTTLDDDGWGQRSSMCKEHTAPKNREDSKPYASIDAGKVIGLVLNIGIATVIDVPGIEVQVPSLSSPGYSVWVLISRGHERFVNENSSSQLVAREGIQPQRCVKGQQ